MIGALQLRDILLGVMDAGIVTEKVTLSSIRILPMAFPS